MPGSLRPVAVLGVGAAAPSLRLRAADAAAAWGAGGGSGTVALCDSDEDTLTLAWQAATDALAAAGVAASEVSGLWWGTARPPFAEGPSHAFLTAALGIDARGSGGLSAGSTHAGMEALCAAWDALAAGHAQVALVVASDALVPGVGTAVETTTGAGAVALVLGAPPDIAADDAGAPAASSSARAASPNGSAPPARLVARATRAAPVLDRYRADTDAATGDVYDARLFREEVFVPLLVSAGAAITGDAGPGTAIEGWAVADPDGRLGAAVAKRLSKPLVGGGAYKLVGDTGSGAALLALVLGTAEGEPTPVRCVGAIGYGGGRATAVVVEVAHAVPGAQACAAVLSGGRQVTYTDALKARGQLAAMVDPIAMGVPPAGAAFVRGNVEMLGFEGAKCRACGVISTPPSIHPHCIGCGGTELDVVRLVRHGSVQTFVVNQTMPPPFQAPLPLVVLDLDDGARLMVQGSPADADELAVGDRVTLVLKRYALERGVPVYGYKALRADPAAPTSGPGPQESATQESATQGSATLDAGSTQGGRT
ncbi:MAG TPA: OB-fold domain-containing protein [Acidimicrobiales bacterium]|nr:OB-fold domain-containing protein [Acidimicrobiales bacterium]